MPVGKSFRPLAFTGKRIDFWCALQILKAFIYWPNTVLHSFVHACAYVTVTVLYAVFPVKVLDVCGVFSPQSHFTLPVVLRLHRMWRVWVFLYCYCVKTFWTYVKIELMFFALCVCWQCFCYMPHLISVFFSLKKWAPSFYEGQHKWYFWVEITGFPIYVCILLST